MTVQQYIDEAKRKEKQGAWEDAILSYEKARVLEPANKSILLSLSRLYLFRNKPIQSLEVLHELKPINDDPDYLLQLSSTYMALNRFDDAEKILIEATHQHHTAPLLNNLGVVSIKLNKLDVAMNCFSKALELDDKNINTWFNLATFYESQGNIDQSLAILKKALDAQKHPDLVERYAQLLARKKRYQEAIEAADEALSNAPKHQGLARTKLKVLFMAGKYNDCLEYIEEIERDNVFTMNLRKEMLEIKEQVHFHLQQYDLCLSSIDDLLKLTQNNPVYFLRKAFVYKSQKDYRNALKWLSQLLKTTNLPPQLRSEGGLLMKTIEMENWKHLVHYFINDPTLRDALMQNPVYALQSRGIMLPEEAVAQIMEWLKNPASSKYFSMNDPSQSIN